MRCSFLNKAHHLLSLYVGVINTLSKRCYNFSQCFIHLEIISGNSDFEAGLQSSWWNTQRQMSGWQDSACFRPFRKPLLPQIPLLSWEGWRRFRCLQWGVGKVLPSFLF